VGPAAEASSNPIDRGEHVCCYLQLFTTLPFFSFEAIIAIFLFNYEYVHKSIETDGFASDLKKATHTHTQISAAAA
jgi:hypothetical protein